MRLAAARIFVSDLSPAVDFYTTLLGPPTAADPGGAYAVFSADGADIVVETVPADASADDLALVGRFTGISFAVDDIDDAYRRFQTCGLRFNGEPELQSWGGRLATVVDPSGNHLQLVQHP
jgi:predicted enzyme related to lactoylglutathione lyase